MKNNAAERPAEPPRGNLIKPKKWFRDLSITSRRHDRPLESAIRLFGLFGKGGGNRSASFSRMPILFASHCNTPASTPRR
jgi:hypothetical protein